MSVLFVDCLENDNGKYRLYIKDNVINLLISKTFINENKNIIKKFKNNINMFIIKRRLKFLKIKELIIVFSEQLEKNIKIKENIKNFLNGFISNLYEVKIQNQIEKNWKVYLDKYIELNNIKIENVKILYFLDRFDDVVYKNILENINRFKELDVYYIGDITSIEYSNLIKKIQYINNELGTTIQNVKYNYDNYYNVFFNFTDYSVRKKYSIQSSSLIIDWYIVENDKLNEYNVILKENYFSFDKILKKVNCKIDNYNTTKLGYILKNNMISK